MKIILFAAGLLLMVLGAVELIRWLSFKLNRGSPQGRLALVVLPGGEDCEWLVRTAAQRVEWMDLRPECRLIVLDNGGKGREIVRLLAGAHPEIECCTLEELPDKLRPDGYRRRS